MSTDILRGCERIAVDTGLPAGSPTSGAFRRRVKHLLCRTLLYVDDAEKSNDSDIAILVSLKIVPEFVALSARLCHHAFMLNEWLQRGTLFRLLRSLVGALKSVAAAHVEKADNVS